MRIQEFYESANGLRGKVFTYEECMDVYAANNSKKEFSYTTDWAGFNVPGNVADKFFRLFDGDLIQKEQTLQELVEQYKAKPSGKHRGKYYIIGTHACLDVSVYVYHEHCHALWYMYPDFRKASKTLLDKLPAKFKQVLCDGLIEDGYDTSVLDDEMNAYLSTSDMYYIKDYLTDQFTGKSFPWNTIYQLQKNFYEYMEEVKFPETFE